MDDLGDSGPKTSTDILKPRSPAGVFNRIMQQRGNRIRLGATVLDDERRDAQEVAEIGDPRPRADLGTVRSAGVLNRLAQTG